jgi:glyoxylase-like metal-dependent hydrolase (beta-lactamase superfamily II)
MSSRALAPAAALAASIVFAAVTPASAQTNVAVQKLADGVWMGVPDRGANVGWFTATDGVVVVDAGNDAETARSVLGKIAETAGKPVRYVVVTHAHADHVGGVAVFAAAGAHVICQENAVGPVAGLLAQARAAEHKPPEAGVIAIADRLGFLGGSRRAAIYFLGAGHTNGDLVVLLPEEKILFSGDLVVSGRLPYMQSADADPHGWEQILTRLVGLDVTKIAPGHGDVGTKQSIADTLAYVRKVNQIAKQFIDMKLPEDLYEMKLRDPDNRIENVTVSAEHIANVKAVVKLERARLERESAAPPGPTAAPRPTPPPPVKRGDGRPSGS